VTDRPVRAPRAEPREIVELRQLKAAQPELASAIDMQIALAEMQRRVQSRVPLPWIQVDPEWLRAQQAAGRPLVTVAIKIPVASISTHGLRGALVSLPEGSVETCDDRSSSPPRP